MQFAVPQFTDIEDKLIGPLTLKQFLMFLGVGAIVFMFWSILGTGIIFFLVAVPIAAAGAYVIFKKYNGRPFFAYLFPFISFLMSPRVLVFKREPSFISFSSKQIKKPETKKTETGPPEAAESRLKKLAYLLDRKFEEEKEIIEKVEHAVPDKADLPPKFPLPINKPKAAHVAENAHVVENVDVAESVVEDEPRPGPKKPGRPKATPKPGPKKFNPDNILKI